MTPPHPHPLPRRGEGERPHCALLCVGSELLRGKVNTHASAIARRLASLHLELNEETTIGDEHFPLAAAIRQALVQCQVVLVTGGLGPTFDDITREAAAAATRRPLVLSRALRAEIAAKFRRAGYRRMPPANLRQAFLIEGAKAILNKVGTAPGQWLRLGSREVPKYLILLPGPPAELYPMLDRDVIPGLRKAFPPLPRAEAHLHFVGVPESLVDQKVRPIIQKWGQTPTSTRGLTPTVEFTILAHLGLVDLDIFVSGATRSRAARTLGRVVGAIRRRLGGSFYGMNGDYPLAKVVGDLFRRRRATLAVAESCTGGMLGSHLTEIPGSSDYFLGGVISYSNGVKLGELGVSEVALRRHGAVSKEVAVAMAQGVRRKLGSTWGLSITGIAGPSGATRDKPVGLVYIGVASSSRANAYEYRFSGSREAIRQRSVIAALDLLRKT